MLEPLKEDPQAMGDFYNHKDDWYRIELSLNEHKDDTTKHITDTERRNWNTKATQADISSAISTHISNVSHGYMVPDWSNTSVITSATYTPSSPGIVYITHNLNAQYAIHVLVNGVQIGQFLDDGPPVGFISVHLNTGDTLTLDWSVQGEEIPFYNSLPSDDNISGQEGYGVYAIFVPFKTV